MVESPLLWLLVDIKDLVAQVEGHAGWLGWDGGGEEEVVGVGWGGGEGEEEERRGGMKEGEGGRGRERDEG